MMLVSIPQGVILLSHRLNLNVNSIVPFSYIIYQANPITNFFLLMKRHKDIRAAVLKTFGYKYSNTQSTIGVQSMSRASVANAKN